MKRTTGPRLLVLLGAALLAFGAPGAAARSRSAKPPSSQKQKTPPQPPPAEQAPSDGPREPGVGDVVELQLAFDVTEAHAGASIVVTARLRDAGGRARDATLHLEADTGVVAAPVRVSQGVYTARVTLPTVLRGRRALLVFGVAGQAAASLALPLASGPAAVLSVEAPQDLPADGANHPLWIGVTDVHGNPSSEPPRVTVTRGELGEPMPIATGEWMIDYRPPRTSWADEDVVTVTAGAAARSQPLSLSPVQALLTVAPSAGLVLGLGGPAAAVGAEATVWVADLPPRLGAVLGVMWWWGARESSRVTMPAGALDLRARRSWLPLTLSAAARQPLGARGTLTLSLGGGAALVASETTLSGQPGVSQSGWAPVALAGLELAFRTRLGAPFVELRGGWIGDPHLDTVRGSAWPVMFLLGSRFDAY